MRAAIDKQRTVRCLIPNHTHIRPYHFYIHISLQTTADFFTHVSSHLSCIGFIIKPFSSRFLDQAALMFLEVNQQTSSHNHCYCSRNSSNRHNWDRLLSWQRFWRRRLKGRRAEHYRYFMGTEMGCVPHVIVVGIVVVALVLDRLTINIHCWCFSERHRVFWNGYVGESCCTVFPRYSESQCGCFG
jgi:hypothetical protein